MTASKQELRAAMRKRRRALTPGEQRRNALQLASHVASRRWFRRARRVALYAATDGEIDLAPLMRLCWRQGKDVYIPRLDRDGHMRFALFRPIDRLVTGPYGIQQPLLAARTAGIEELDIIFAPLVAFTREGARLGMGGGYYDRAFSARRRGLLVGVAHSCQQADSLPRDPWDVTMDGVLTEKGPLGAPFKRQNSV